MSLRQTALLIVIILLASLGIAVFMHPDGADGVREMLGLPRSGETASSGTTVKADPVLDKDRSQHGALVVYGNDRIGRWAAVPALTSAERILRTIEKALSWG